MSNWFISFRSVSAIFGGHFSYLIVHLCILGCGILTFLHAKASGSRFLYFWYGALLHGVLLENGITGKRYWHAQAPIMLFGKRLPLHMVLFYPSVLYLSVMAVRKFNLSLCSEPFAIGILVMMMEIPFRIVSVKFLHITYHDSDPMYASKFYGVPWIEIFSSLVFATSYAANYYALKYRFLSENSVQWERVECDKKEAVVTGICGVLSPISGFLQKVFSFHMFYDLFNINPPTCLLLLFAVYFSVVFCLERKKKDKHMEVRKKVFLYYALGVYIGCLLFIAMVCKPQNEISIGTHQPTGDCTTLLCTRSPLGKVMKRKKYLCIDDVQERRNFVFNFACLPEGPPYLNAMWYTVCGTALRNRAQFLVNIFSFVLLISVIFLKSLLTEKDIIMIKKKLSKLETVHHCIVSRCHREPVVTFEESGSGTVPNEHSPTEVT